jgi:hypothetical protein
MPNIDKDCTKVASDMKTKQERKAEMKDRENCYLVFGEDESLSCLKNHKGNNEECDLFKEEKNIQNWK